MLDPKKNYIDYSELLKPPPGYLLSRAIGTTYSLDLQALLSIPVAMYYSKTLETDFTQNESPLDVFDSISKAAKTVTIFCQKGKIKVPKKFNKLIHFTEECVREITPNSAYSSFHPKCWWLWFFNPNTDEKIVRFSITSRNLTFDQSWDISFSFEGKVTSEVQPKNQSMIDMLDYLEAQDGLVIEESLKKQLLKTLFENDLPFTSWSFHPIGISTKYVNPLSNKYFRPEVLLMMSPFLDDNSVTAVAEKASEKCWLFSRRVELQKLKPDTIQHLAGSYCIPENIVSGQFIDTFTDDLPNSDRGFLDLHAKLYISQKGYTNTWFLGSANLSDPAFNRNIECLFEMKTDDDYYKPRNIYKELVTNENEKKLFEEYFHSDRKAEDEVDIQLILRKLIHNIINSKLSGIIIPDEAEKYFSYKMIFDAASLHIPNEIKVYLQPWSISTSSGDFGSLIVSKQINHLSYDQQLKESQLSKYFIFSITYKGIRNNSFLVKADIDLPQTRDGKILSEIINSKEKFLQYLRFLLSNTGIVDDTETNSNKNNPAKDRNSDGVWSKYNLPLYEELLKASSQHPEKLRYIDELMTKLKVDEHTREFIPVELEELLEVFKKVINEIQ